MSQQISVILRQQVIRRANNRCEYCGLSQRGQAATFHIDHIVPVSAGGQTTNDNLALACVGCSLHKSARRFVVDPLTGESVSIFHPRQDSWSDHFRWDEPYIVGLTSKGRATIQALKMNRPIMISIRQEEKLLGRHPYIP